MPARSVLMVEPAGFAPNPTTADDNAFQTDEGFSPEEAESLACDEFRAVVEALRRSGVEASTFTGDPDAPDSVFPNNWFSTHEDGTLVLYPMRSDIRRRERRADIIAWLSERYPNLVNLTSREERGQFLEGTGSLVLDRRSRIAYAALSQRTHESTARFWAQRMAYDLVMFETADSGGMPVYHTNVVLALGERWAVVCSESILQPAPVLSALLASGRELIEITWTQAASFCGNVLELGPGSTNDLPSVQADRKVIAMSETAWNAFTSDQKQRLQSHGSVLAMPIPTIERFGGGSLRCMIAELF